MDVGCYADSKVVKGGVGELEPRLEPQRTSRELALGNIGIGQGVRNSSNEDPEHSLGIEVDGGEFLGPWRKELGDEWEDERERWPTEKMKEQEMKSSLATISVAIRILIRFLILILFWSSSSKACFLEA
jgi:hypothetical protein